MKIEVKKATKHQCQYSVTRNDKSVERITLETKTYLVHDICHFAVEDNLHYVNGFWGLLSQGHSVNSLFGKDNPQTIELRFIERIVGPVQSVYSGHIPKEDFEQYISHLDNTMTNNFLGSCLTEIRAILQKWEQLSVGQYLTLKWRL